MNRLLVAGFLVMIAGMLIVLFGSAGGKGLSTGGFVLIGPIPIVFGTGTNGGQIASLAFFAGLLMFVAFVVWAWRLGRLRG